MVDGVHNFDRRASDVNVAALGTEIRALSETVHERIVPSLDDNTRICTQLREAVFGKNEDDGLAMKVQEMHDVFSKATNGMRVLAALGNGVVKGIEIGGKIAKPLIYIIMLIGALLGLVKGVPWDKLP